MQATTDSTGKSFPAHFHDTVIAVSSTATTSAAASTATTASTSTAAEAKATAAGNEKQGDQEE
jgi:hypothetical protein